MINKAQILPIPIPTYILLLSNKNESITAMRKTNSQFISR